jgi:hypothetical protein
MAFLFAAPATDASFHREDNHISPGRATQQRKANKGPLTDGPRSSMDGQVQEGAQDALAADSTQRRNVVFPDPLAFRYVAPSSAAGATIFSHSSYLGIYPRIHVSKLSSGDAS